MDSDRGFEQVSWQGSPKYSGKPPTNWTGGLNGTGNTDLLLSSWIEPPWRATQAERCPAGLQ